MDKFLLDVMKNTTVEKYATCNEAEYCVCGPNPVSPDDVRTTCHDCGGPIAHRWHAPKKPKKICLACFRIRAGKEIDKIQVIISPYVVKDVRKILNESC